MKKIISLLVILMMIIVLAACDGTVPGTNVNGGSGNEVGDNSGGSDDNAGSDNTGDEDNNPGNNSGNDSDNTGNGGSGSDNTGNGSNNNENNNNGGNNNGSTIPDNPIEPDKELTPEEKAELELFYELFDCYNHISLKLDISDSELMKIQKDFEYYSSFGSKSPIYRMADLHITITKPDGSSKKYVIDQVGVRMKGNTSRDNFYSESDGMYNLVHFKISFGETFDDEGYYGSEALVWSDSSARKERKNRTFATLEKIDIRWNRNDDTTYIRETYAYDLYREFGVLAPHTNLASVDIGKDHAGVFTIYEPVDKIFLEKNLPDDAIGGDLYKLGWTYEGATFTSFKEYGVEDEDAGKFYIYDLKTNKKTSNHESLKNLITKINQGITKEGIADLIDIDNFMYFCAVSYFIGNPDDLRHNYNNCYIYFRADTGKAIFIPYDLDRGLGVNTWNPTKHGMTEDDPFQRTAAGNGNRTSPIFLKTVCRDGVYLQEYVAALVEVDASRMLTNEIFKARYEVSRNLYKDDTTPSKQYHNAYMNGNPYNFCFDISKTANPNEDLNMSFADYISKKRASFYGYISSYLPEVPDNSENPTDPETPSNPDNNDTPTEPVKPEPIKDCDAFIRGDFNGWSNDDKYRMTKGDNGIFTITLAMRSSFSFKVYNDRTGKWYGSEIVHEDCQVSFTTDDNTNINLKRGTYLITFDTVNVTIMIEKVD